MKHGGRRFAAGVLLTAALAAALITRAWCPFASEYLQSFTVPSPQGNGSTIKLHLTTECGTVTRITLAGDIAPIRMYPPDTRCYAISGLAAPRGQDLGDLSATLIAQRLKQGGWKADDPNLAADAATIASLLTSVAAGGEQALLANGPLDTSTLTYGHFGRLAALSQGPGQSVAPRPQALIGLVASGSLLLAGLLFWPRRAKTARGLQQAA